MTRDALPGRVRIIGGEWRRRWLPVPAAQGLRPTADRVRETLFNWLMPQLPGARCLDLFAGTGVLGLEALSRGASHATFVERDTKVFAQLVHNAELLQAGNRASLVNADASQFLLTQSPTAFDIVFLDPPFAGSLMAEVMPRLMQGWLAPDALLYLEFPRAGPGIALPEGWRMMREGQTRQAGYGLATRA
ncbi:MAG: 16S rRNA (guanine(966)-N(2))-methyltransferase RsmD [Gammaproteobacteria bacterium]|nr:16S rRNA (guanine(966)-N(2))-methyltransferase RsmD [Gammaproteobacteria bacterium]